MGADAPQGITLEAQPVPEQATHKNYQVGTLSAIDVDAGDNHTYTMLGGYNILGYWDFDALEVDPETGVVTVEDAIQGKDGVLKNFDSETALTNGADGEALDFGAADDRVDIPEIGESGRSTFAFWVFRKK